MERPEFSPTVEVKKVAASLGDDGVRALRLAKLMYEKADRLDPGGFGPDKWSKVPERSKRFWFFLAYEIIGET